MNESTGEHICLICEKKYQQGVIYPVDEALYDSHKAIREHVAREHGSLFDYYLDMGKIYTGLTENQKDLMKMFYEGLPDKEIVKRTGATSTSTIRNQRFTIKEKYKQARILLTLSELLEEQKKELKSKGADSPEALVEIHRTATNIDERYAITQEENDEVISRYFDSSNHLVIKEFPAKEKKKIIILRHLMQQFDRNKQYQEKEVNEILKKFYEDYVTIRRYLVQYGFLDRSKNSEYYWVKT